MLSRFVALVWFLSAAASAQITFNTARLEPGCTPANVLAADFNGDSRPDALFVCKPNQSAFATLMLNAGDGTLAAAVPISAPALATSANNRVVAGDFNRDGRADLAYISSAGTLVVLLSNGDGTFTTSTTTPANPKVAIIAVGDLNNDNVPDLILVPTAGDNMVLYAYAKGDGSFGEPVSLAWPTALTTPFGTNPNPRLAVAIVQDMNGDGLPDLMMVAAQTIKPGSSPFDTYFLYISYGQASRLGAPTEIAVFGDTNSLVADIDGDGKPDFVCWGTFTGDLAFQLSGGKPTGSAVVPDGPGLAADFDQDGRADIAWISSASNSVNTASFTTTFKTSGSTPLGATAIDIATADFNGDGKPDIITANTASATLALNTTTVQPRVSAALNAASFAGTGLAPGTLASLFGAGFPSALTQAASIPLPFALNGISLTVGGVPAPLLFTSATQINFQVPWTLAPGSAAIVVTVNGKALPAFTTTIAAVQPGIFALAYGSGQAIAINADGSLAGASGSVPGYPVHPAKTGDTILVLGTGLGAVTPTVATGASSLDATRSTVVKPRVLIGGLDATVAFSGLAPQFVGVNQLNVVIPAGLAGTVPIQLDASGTRTTNQITIAVTP